MKTKIGNWTDEPCFYVTVTDAGKIGCLAGPFRKHEDALAVVDRCRPLEEKRDPFACFYAFGTSKFKTGHLTGHLTGPLNEDLRPDGLWTGEGL